MGRTKAEAIVSLLEAAKGEFLSGQQIADLLGVSRTVIWNEMKKLEERGYEIESVTRKGYRLVDAPLILRESELREVMREVFGSEAPALRYFETIDSTNLEAKRMLSAGIPPDRRMDEQPAPRQGEPHSERPGSQREDGAPATLLYAQEQTGGRGRLGRSWSSRRGDGIYMSLLMPTKLPLEWVPMLTLQAGVCLCSALRTATGLDVRVKWPNDILVEDRKLCGILTEMTFESDRVQSVILGFGINTGAEFEAGELEQTATSLQLLGIKLSQKDLIRYILKELMPWMEAVQRGDASCIRYRERTVEFLRKHSATLGRDIVVHRLHDAGEGIPAKALDINDSGELIVQCADGSRMTVRSGEVQIRKRSSHATDL